MRNERPNQPIIQWLKRVLLWLRKLYRARNEQPRILEETFSIDRRTRLISISREVIGAVATYRLLNSSSQGSLLVTVDNTKQLREHLRRTRQGSNSARGRQPEELSGIETLYLKNYQQYSHRVGVFWCFYSRNSVKLKCLYIIDIYFPPRYYQKNTRSVIISGKEIEMRERVSDKIARSVVLAMLTELRDMQPTDYLNWSERIHQVNYYDLLKDYIESWYRVNDPSNTTNYLTCIRATPHDNSAI